MDYNGYDQGMPYPSPNMPYPSPTMPYPGMPMHNMMMVHMIMQDPFFRYFAMETIEHLVEEVMEACHRMGMPGMAMPGMPGMMPMPGMPGMMPMPGMPCMPQMPGMPAPPPPPYKKEE
ncbi:MAG: hypothetical protein QME46_03930 [Thermoanaerobacteraceae bacterium]|nr:hypothetical protein [Thermoanaerobacteraceae bacterium]